MLKKIVSYKDFDGKEQTEELYFHMTKAELVEFVSNYPDDFSGYIQGIVAANKKAELISLFRDLILKSYGTKDGSRFVKSTQASEDFSHTEAYSVFFLELLEKTENLVAFFNSVLNVDVSSLASQN